MPSPRPRRYRQTITVEAIPLFDLITETAGQLRGQEVAVPPEVFELPAAEIHGRRTRSGRRSGR